MQFILDKIKNKEDLFVNTLRIYWLLFLPTTYIIKFLYKESLFTDNTVFLMIFFFASSSVIVFYIQLFRSIYNEKKFLLNNNKTKSIILLFVVWSWLFIITFGYKTFISAAFSFVGKFPIPLYQEIIIFAVALFGEYIIARVKNVPRL